MEVSSQHAAEIIGTTGRTIQRYVDRELLPARREGIKRIIRVKIDDLRTFADRYGFKFDEELATKLSRE